MATLLAMCHNSTINSVRDFVENCEMDIFQFLSKDYDLKGHQRSYHFEGLSLGYLKANFHNFTTNK